jgi:hypothetical protein
MSRWKSYAGEALRPVPKSEYDFTVSCPDLCFSSDF